MSHILKLPGFMLACALGAAAAPTITGIFNAASWVPSGLANGSIAQGSIFVVTGSGLGPATLQQQFTYPLPATQGLAGTSIQVVVGSQGFDCPMIYSSDGQVAAVLPSRTLLGTGTLNLLYQGNRATFPIRVVQSSFGMFAINQGGSGPAVVTGTAYDVKTPVNAAHPGDVLVAWGTGLGATTGDETQPPAQVDLNSGAQVFVGNQAATVLYAGRGSSPGVDQINFVVPAGVSGCYVSLAVQVRGVISNFTTLPVAPAGQSVCSDVGQFTPGDLQRIQSAGRLNFGLVSLIRAPGAQDQASAAFEAIGGSAFLSRLGVTGAVPSAGSCAVNEFAAGTYPLAGGSPGLDAGTLTLRGPSGTQTLPVTGSNMLNPGTYTISGSGGAKIGPFSVTFNFPPPIAWTNIGSATLIARGQDFTVTWSGASPNDVIALTGTTTAPASAAGQAATIQFVCAAPASAGQFTVPALVTALLPLNGMASDTLPGVALSLTAVPVTTFHASGLDTGYIYTMNASASRAGIQ